MKAVEVVCLILVGAMVLTFACIGLCVLLDSIREWKDWKDKRRRKNETDRR